MNPFSVIIGITAVLLITSFVTGIIGAELFNLELPVMPEFPTWATNLNWTVSLVDWSGIGSAFVLLGGVIVYGLSFIVYMFQMSGAMLALLGGLPANVGIGIGVLIGLALTGGILGFIRGGHTSK
jgi:hypothetical protein